MAFTAFDWSFLALRLVLGAIFIAHGYPKMKDIKGTADFLKGIGFKPAMFWAFVLGATEFFGGIALLVGFAMQIVAVLLFVAIFVATLLKVFKWKEPFTKQGGMGYEFDLLILAVLIALFLLGAGAISLEQMLEITL